MPIVFLLRCRLQSVRSLEKCLWCERMHLIQYISLVAITNSFVEFLGRQVVSAHIYVHTYILLSNVQWRLIDRT